jgi:hypothetical protein
VKNEQTRAYGRYFAIPKHRPKAQAQITESNLGRRGLHNVVVDPIPRCPWQLVMVVSPRPDDQYTIGLVDVRLEAKEDLVSVQVCIHQPR